MRRKLPKKAPRPWSKVEDRHLTLGVGAYGWVWFRQKLPTRTDAEIRGRMRRLFGAATLTRGVYTLEQVRANTGYHHTQLRRAQRALGQKWRRTCVGGVYLISEEQVEELTAWLVQDYWAKKLDLYGCCWCGSREREHRSVGLCAPCYWQSVRLARALGLPVTLAGKRDLIQELVGAGALARDDGALERCKAKLRKGVTPAIDDLELLARVMEVWLWS